MKIKILPLIIALLLITSLFTGVAGANPANNETYKNYEFNQNNESDGFPLITLGLSCVGGGTVSIGLTKFAIYSIAGLIGFAGMLDSAKKAVELALSKLLTNPNANAEYVIPDGYVSIKPINIDRSGMDLLESVYKTYKKTNKLGVYFPARRINNIVEINFKKPLKTQEAINRMKLCGDIFALTNSSAKNLLIKYNRKTDNRIYINGKFPETHGTIEEGYFKHYHFDPMRKHCWFYYDDFYDA